MDVYPELHFYFATLETLIVNAIFITPVSIKQT